MTYDLTASIHKGTCSSAHLGHNRRTIAVPHADKERSHLNVCYVDMSLEEAYQLLFGAALEEYNRGKKPSRQIKNYFEHITSQYEEGERKLQEARSRGASFKEQARIKSRYPKPYYEMVVAVGNSDVYEGAFRCGGDQEELAVKVLDEYMRDFQNRNPHLFVFSSWSHRDEEGVPHIHIDYIPWTDLEGRGLPVRVSENGAFKQQGLTTGERGDSGTIAFQYQERQALAEIARKHGITIVEGKHSKKHLSKEEYILHREQERAGEDRKLIEQQAGELLQYQDEFAHHLRSIDMEEAFAEHIENISLRGEVADYAKQEAERKQMLAACWEDYNQFTSDFFAMYRANKKHLWEELRQARETSRLNKKRLDNLIYDITNRSDFFIVKIVKLFMALTMAVRNVHYENEIERLQDANNALKQQAREVMAQSSDVSAVLRTKDLDDIEQALQGYETALQDAVLVVDETMREVQRQDSEVAI